MEVIKIEVKNGKVNSFVTPREARTVANALYAEFGAASSTEVVVSGSGGTIVDLLFDLGAFLAQQLRDEKTALKRRLHLM